MPVYVVKGGEQNPSYQGGSRMPILGYFEGEHGDVLLLAKTLEGWECYGEGKIEEIVITKVTQEVIQEAKDLYQLYRNAQYNKKTAEDQLERAKTDLKVKGFRLP